MTLKDFVDVLVTSEVMPINVFQPSADPDGEREPVIQFITSEIEALKTVISNATVAKIEINKLAKGPATKQVVNVEINVELDSRVLV